MPWWYGLRPDPAAVGADLPARGCLSLLRELAGLCQGQFEAKPGLMNWLDGTPWPYARLAALDIDGEEARAAESARQFGGRGGGLRPLLRHGPPPETLSPCRLGLLGR